MTHEQLARDTVEPVTSAEHATCNLQLATQEPVACAFFTEKGEVAYTGIYDRTLKALERVKTTRMGISAGSIDLYVAPVAAQEPAADGDALDAARYRWLRKRWGRLDESYANGGPKITSLRVLTDQEVQDGYGWDVDPESLDAAIDAAMKEQGHG